MTIKIPKHVFEGAAHEADVHDTITWDATDMFESVYSKHCPAIRGSETDFAKFYGVLILRWYEEGNADEAMVLDLGERVTSRASGRHTLYGFAGLELT